MYDCMELPEKHNKKNWKNKSICVHLSGRTTRKSLKHLKNLRSGVVCSTVSLTFVNSALMLPIGTFLNLNVLFICLYIECSCLPMVQYSARGLWLELLLFSLIKERKIFKLPARGMRQWSGVNWSSGKCLLSDLC